MTNHKSHHIFIYLGILVGLFVLIFGINYFQSHYTFQKTEAVIATQDYDEGALTESPFVPKEVERVEESDPFTGEDKDANCISIDSLFFCVEVVHSTDLNRPTSDDVSIIVKEINIDSQKIYSIENLGMSLASANYLDILSVNKLTDDIYEIIFVEGLSGYGEGDPRIIEYSKSSGDIDLSKKLSPERIEEYRPVRNIK